MKLLAAQNTSYSSTWYICLNICHYPLYFIIFLLKMPGPDPLLSSTCNYFSIFLLVLCQVIRIAGTRLFWTVGGSIAPQSAGPGWNAEQEKKNTRKAMVVMKHASWCWTTTLGDLTLHALICVSARAVILGAVAANQEEEISLFQRAEMSSVRQEGNHANLSGKLIKLTQKLILD